MNNFNDPTVYISESALWNLLLCAIEVYKKETFGILLGSYSEKENHFNIEFAIGFQSAKRGYSWVEQSISADKRMSEFLEYLPQLSILGHFHSHTNGKIGLSEVDKNLLKKDKISALVSIKEKSEEKMWKYHKDGTLSGTVGRYFLKIAVYYLSFNEKKERKAKILCPYAIGFRYHTKVYKDTF